MQQENNDDPNNMDTENLEPSQSPSCHPLSPQPGCSWHFDSVEVNTMADNILKATKKLLKSITHASVVNAIQRNLKSGVNKLSLRDLFPEDWSFKTSRKRRNSEDISGVDTKKSRSKKYDYISSLALAGFWAGHPVSIDKFSTAPSHLPLPESEVINQPVMVDSSNSIEIVAESHIGQFNIDGSLQVNVQLPSINQARLSLNENTENIVCVDGPIQVNSLTLNNQTQQSLSGSTMGNKVSVDSQIMTKNELLPNNETQPSLSRKSMGNKVSVDSPIQITSELLPNNQTLVSSSRSSMESKVSGDSSTQIKSALLPNNQIEPSSSRSGMGNKVSVESLAQIISELLPNNQTQPSSSRSSMGNTVSADSLIQIKSALLPNNQTQPSSSRSDVGSKVPFDSSTQIKSALLPNNETQPSSSRSNAGQKVSVDRPTQIISELLPNNQTQPSSIVSSMGNKDSGDSSTQIKSALLPNNQTQPSSSRSNVGQKVSVDRPTQIISELLPNNQTQPSSIVSSMGNKDSGDSSTQIISELLPNNQTQPSSIVSSMGNKDSGDSSTQIKSALLPNNQTQPSSSRSGIGSKVSVESLAQIISELLPNNQTQPSSSRSSIKNRVSGDSLAQIKSALLPNNQTQSSSSRSNVGYKVSIDSPTQIKSALLLNNETQPSSSTSSMANKVSLDSPTQIKSKLLPNNQTQPSSTRSSMGNKASVDSPTQIKSELLANNQSQLSSCRSSMGNKVSVDIPTQIKSELLPKNQTQPSSSRSNKANEVRVDNPIKNNTQLPPNNQTQPSSSGHMGNKVCEEIYRKLRAMFPNIDKDYIKTFCPADWLPGISHDVLFGNIVERILVNEASWVINVNPTNFQVVEGVGLRLNVDDIYEHLTGIFPNADPHYLRSTAEKLKNGNDVETFVAEKLTSNDYPTREQYLAKIRVTEEQERYTKNFKVEQFLSLFPDPVKHFEDDNRKLNYCVTAVEFLKNVFCRVRVNTINKMYRFYRYNISLTAKNLRLTTDFIVNPRRPSMMATEDISLLQEMAFVRHYEEIRNHMITVKQKEEEEFNSLKVTGKLWTCQCCYDEECLPSKCSTCDNAHVFCNSCIVNGTDSKLGDGETHVPCFLSCGSEFSISTLQKVLPPTKFSILLKKRQAAEVMAAGLEGLVSCPFCHFASIPPEGDKVFKCLNPECMKESCIQCKECNHVPYACGEMNSKKENARKYIEEKMTQALTRTCYKCKKAFFKEEGCNKMQCPCGAVMCYICNHPVTNYKHFRGQGSNEMEKCPLWTDNVRLNAEIVRKVEEDARKKILSADPSLDIDTTRLAPALPPRSSGPHRDIEGTENLANVLAARVLNNDVSK